MRGIKIRKVFRWMVVLFFSSTILAVMAYRFLPVYITPLMVIRCFQQVGRGESLTMHHHWVSFDKISPHMPVAVMAKKFAVMEYDAMPEPAAPFWVLKLFVALL